jgi:hypothetical protein
MHTSFPVNHGTAAQLSTGEQRLTSSKARGGRALWHRVTIAYAKHGLPDLLWNPNMSRENALDDASARRAALAKLFRKPAAAVTEPVKMQPPVPDSVELVATARAAKLQRAEKANSIRMKRLHR